MEGERLEVRGERRERRGAAAAVTGGDAAEHAGHLGGGEAVEDALAALLALDDAGVAEAGEVERDGGDVGAGGLGMLIDERIGWRDYNGLGTLLLMLFILVVTIETLSQYLRKKLS